MPGTALVEEQHTPQFMELWRERVSIPYHRLLRKILESARRQGEIDAGVDLEMIIDMMLGAYYARHLSGEPFPDDWPQAVVDAVLKSLGRSS